MRLMITWKWCFLEQRNSQAPESLEDDLKTTIDKELKSNNIYKWKEETTIYAVDCFNNAVFRSLFSEETLPLYESLFLNHAAVKLLLILKTQQKFSGRLVTRQI